MRGNSNIVDVADCSTFSLEYIFPNTAAPLFNKNVRDRSRNFRIRAFRNVRVPGNRIGEMRVYSWARRVGKIIYAIVAPDESLLQPFRSLTTRY